MTCSLCDHTGWRPLEDNGVRRVVRCDCWRQNAVAQAMRDAGIPPRYETSTLDNFQDYSDSLVTAVTKARAFTATFPVFDKGLLLLGCGESAIRFCPPLCVTAEQVDTALRMLGKVLAERRAMKKTG